MSSNEAPRAKRRRSSSVTLVLVGASALSACGPGAESTDTMQRDLYASKADCVQDWGTDPAKCEPAPSSSTTRPGSSHYWGPAYSRGSYSGTRTGGTPSQARSGSRAIGSSSVSRGGFGSRASSHSSSGSRASSSS